MKDMPRITIVTPSYNQGQYLEETIVSVLSQDYPNLEYFVLDGGSNDNSVEIIKKFSDRIDWWVSEKDNGQTDAINKGFRRATGDLLCWVNSDDLLLPGCLREIAQCYIEEGRPDLIHSNMVFIDSNSYILRAIRIPKQTRFFMERGVWSVSAPTSFFSRALMEQVGFLNEKYHIAMDMDIWMRMIIASGKIAKVNNYLGAFRWHELSKSTLDLKSKRFKNQENPENKEIFNNFLKSSSQSKRYWWRKIWQIYQLLNLNYIRAFLNTQAIGGKALFDVFPFK
ncbi:MAG: glycosyltransferase [Ardenticatenaceae bacterium]|nr:glycosyltransferase [Ardenticatenaceae bacterium]